MALLVLRFTTPPRDADGVRRASRRGERDLIGARTREALAARVARGGRNGRRTAIPAGLLRRIVMSRDAGATFRTIAAELTDERYLSPTGLPTWQESTVRRAYASATRAA